MPVPYLGSKRKSAGKIYQTIQNLNPKSNVLIDLFCGGFAISEYFIKNGWQVISNDKNKYVIALLDQTINKGLDEKKCLEFVTRNKFYHLLENKDKYDDWYVGYVMCIWSFGNNQKGYLFSKRTEQYKKAGHELVVNRDPSLIKEMIPNIPQKYVQGILSQKDWQTRRIALRKVSTAMKTRVLEIERLQQLERLHQLEQLEQLEGLERLKLYSKSYDEIDIPDGAVVYCDPPYHARAEYSEGGFDHDRFWSFVKKVAKTNKIYVSEYRAPKGFKKVLAFPQKSTLQGGHQKHKNQPDECLFTI